MAGTVAQLKLEIMEKEGLPESSIRLVHHGKLLEDTDNLGHLLFFYFCVYYVTFIYAR